MIRRVGVKTQPLRRRVDVKSRPERLHVLVFASKRSGSSFFSELLNNHPNFVYYFEPLTCLTAESTRKNYTNKVFNKKAIDIMQRLFTWDVSPLHAIGKTSAKGRLCKHGKVLSRTSYCKETSKSAVELTQLFSMYEHVAIKTIRLYDLNLLQALANNPDINLKIIHLVRDPRGIWNSRLDLNKSNHDYLRRRPEWDEITDLCQTMMHTLQVVHLYPKWLHGKYFLARYEDAAIDPIGMAEKLYKFLGLRLPIQVKKWLNTHTQETDDGEFTTTKNSTEIATQWRQTLPFETVLDIQNKCRRVMKGLGYQDIVESKDMKNNSINVISAGPNIIL
ncbi:carbohydrate sulfotransferase 1-like [Glandiceps talaboti]